MFLPAIRRVAFFYVVRSIADAGSRRQRGLLEAAERPKGRSRGAFNRCFPVWRVDDGPCPADRRVLPRRTGIRGGLPLRVLSTLGDTITRCDLPQDLSTRRLRDVKLDERRALVTTRFERVGRRALSDHRRWRSAAAARSRQDACEIDRRTRRGSAQLAFAPRAVACLGRCAVIDDAFLADSEALDLGRSRSRGSRRVSCADARTSRSSDLGLLGTHLALWLDVLARQDGSGEGTACSVEGSRRAIRRERRSLLAGGIGTRRLQRPSDHVTPV